MSFLISGDEPQDEYVSEQRWQSLSTLQMCVSYLIPELKDSHRGPWPAWPLLMVNWGPANVFVAHISKAAKGDNHGSLHRYHAGVM